MVSGMIADPGKDEGGSAERCRSGNACYDAHEEGAASHAYSPSVRSPAPLLRATWNKGAGHRIRRPNVPTSDEPWRAVMWGVSCMISRAWGRISAQNRPSFSVLNGYRFVRCLAGWPDHPRRAVAQKREEPAPDRDRPMSSGLRSRRAHRMDKPGGHRAGLFTSAYLGSNARPRPYGIQLVSV